MSEPNTIGPLVTKLLFKRDDFTASYKDNTYSLPAIVTTINIPNVAVMKYWVSLDELPEKIKKLFDGNTQDSVSISLEEISGAKGIYRHTLSPEVAKSGITSITQNTGGVTKITPVGVNRTMQDFASLATIIGPTEAINQQQLGRPEGAKGEQPKV